MEFSFEKIVKSVDLFLSSQVLNNEFHKIILAIIVFFVVYFGLKFTMKYIHRIIESYTKDKKENM
jgi:Na+/H+ antiporter NhaC